MYIDVCFNAHALTPTDVHGRVVLVIDVLRASTTIAVALASGARAVIPFESAEEAIARSKSFERQDVRLAGERRMRTIPGFDLGNSPREFTREAVEGKTILFTTSNGTAALTSIKEARDVVVGSYVNFAATCAFMRAAARADTDIVIVCAGRDRQFSLEDAVCAGRYVRGIAQGDLEPRLSDGALAACLLDTRHGENPMELFQLSSHGRALAEAGFADDLAVCAAVDAYPVVPVYQERQIVRLGHVRER
ncbi:MAG TPA: 2-phosphosulfolactate phosphatase [Gemmatimonadaceae bacterium]